MLILLQAMAHEEGYFARGLTADRPQRNNNPGDLLWCPETRAFGATEGDPTFAVFPNVQLGWKALQRWLSVRARFDQNGSLVGGYLGATLRQLVFRFAPPNQNNSAAYLAFICAQTGLQESSIITQQLLATPEAGA